MDYDESVDAITQLVLENIRSTDLHRLREALNAIEKHASNDLVLLSLQQKGAISLLVKKMNQLTLSIENDESGEIEALVDGIAQSVAYLSGPTASGPRTRQFLMPDDSNIVIREASFSEGFLGWETWNAAIVFASWIYKNKNVIENANVIELGCGTSLAGIACARNGAAHVTLTDHNEAILKYAQINADANECAQTVTVSYLDWNDVVAGTNDAECHRGAYDVVVGTDICYNPEHPKLLPPVIKALLKHRANSPNARPLFLASVMRKRPEIPVFEEEMILAGFQVKSREEISFQKPDSNIVTDHFVYVWELGGSASSACM